MALEKALKGLVCKTTHDLAPPPNPTEALRYAARADEVLQWLLSLL